ncbi:MAG: hypothetical protein ACRDD1_11855, partial [Planctomycetia bacterium]
MAQLPLPNDPLPPPDGAAPPNPEAPLEPQAKPPTVDAAERGAPPELKMFARYFQRVSRAVASGEKAVNLPPKT